MRVLRRTPPWLGVLLAVAWCVLIWQLSSLPPRSAGRRVAWRAIGMNLLHAPEYGALALWVVMAFGRVTHDFVLTRARAWTVLVICTAYGIVDEIHQGWVPGRDASVPDLITDMCGVWLMLAALRVLQRDGADGRELWRACAVPTAACFAAAIAATFLQDFFPTWEWL